MINKKVVSMTGSLNLKKKKATGNKLFKSRCPEKVE